MKKILAYILLAAAGCMLLAACQETDVKEAPYLKAIPESFEGTALGEGDAFLFSVRSNVAWTLKAVDENDNEIDWIRFEQAAGEGDADIFCVILRGSQEEARGCTVVLASVDGKFEKRLTLGQTVFVPVIRNVGMRDVLALAGSVPVGGTDYLEEFCFFDAQVTGVPGGNLPDGYIFISDDGTAFARVKTAQASTVKVGDVITMDTTGGTITKGENGITLNITSPVEIKSSGAPTIPAAYIPASYVPMYENALVELRCAQVQDSDLGKTWTGDVSLCTWDESSDNSFQTHVESSAAFASNAVPSGSGTIVGIVVDGKLRPRDATDLAGLTEPRGSASGAVVTNKITPLYCYLKNAGAANKYTNATAEGKTRFTFTEEPGYSYAGPCIEKVEGGTDNNLTFASAVATPFLAIITFRGWDVSGTHYLFTIPLGGQKIWGDLMLMFGLCCGSSGVFTGDWTITWSADGTNWKPVDAVYCETNKNPADAAGNTFRIVSTSSYVPRQVAEFHIPEEEAISSGAIYFKMVPPVVTSANHSKTLRWLNGFYLCSRVPNTPRKTYHTVVAMENFENCWTGHDPVIGVPLYNFARFDGAPAYSSEEGWYAVGGCVGVRGCALLTAKSGENYIMTPPLTKLASATDLTVTFKASPYVDASAASLVINGNAISAFTDGPGTASKITWDSNYTPYEWHTGTFTVKGATSGTKIGIGVTDPSASNCAFYIDDIIVTR